MGTRSVDLDGRVAVATGPLTGVTVSWKNGVGEWFLVADGDTSSHGHWFGQKREPFDLGAGETLEVYGQGLLVATATTFHADFDALPDAT